MTISSSSRGWRGDRAAAIAAAVRTLASESHRERYRPESGEPDGRGEALGSLFHRINDLRRLLDEGQQYGLRLWLANLQRQVLIEQEWGVLRGHAERC